MPIYMDIHNVPGIEAIDVAEAHQKDMAIQEKYQCKAMTYWVDESKDSAFCLIEAPNPEAVIELHNKAHGLMTHQIIELNSTVVESFLGRIYDPETSEILEGQLKVFNDPAFRVLMIIQSADPIFLIHRFGKQKTHKLLLTFKGRIKDSIEKCEGKEVECLDAVTIVSFTSSIKAVECALSIQDKLSVQEKKLLECKISINAGMPVSKSKALFGDTIQFAKRLFYTTTKANQIVAAFIIKEIIHKNYPELKNKKVITLSSNDEKILDQFMNILEQKSNDPNVSVSDFCKYMALSKSGLYRKIQNLANRSPNSLIKEFRLQKAMEFMKMQGCNISEAAFKAGFSSADYFSKCFLKTYGMLPSNYKDKL